ncbi:MAG: sugar phosphate isomerase/epimerase [Clostridia bacterium]|nr:sugar phosphate isomerase/epimerase [Clostridia bacterium]
MKAGISTASLFLRCNNEDAVSFLNEIKTDTAEVFLTSRSEYGYPFAELLVKNKGDLLINSVHALTSDFEPQLFSAHPRVRDDATELLDKVLESANTLHAKYYSFHGLVRAKKGEREGVKDHFDKLIARFSDISERCERAGVTLCLENVEWSTYNRLGVFQTIANEVKTLRGVLDIKQARLSGIPYENYLTEMGEKIAYVHISDIDENGKMCLPGKGVFDFKTLLKRLNDVGFDGALLIEAYAGDYERIEELKNSYAYVKELLGDF